MPAIPFAAWEPDASDRNRAVATVARNVLPAAASYLPLKGADTAYSAALAAAPRGYWTAQKQDGTFVLFAGTSTKLYRFNSATLAWDDVSNGAGTYTALPADDDWSFAQFDRYLYATQANDVLQRIDVEAGSAFADVSGSPPQARFIDVVENHLMLGGLTDDTAGVAWSDTFDPTNWSTGNADQQVFAEGGPVLAVCGAAKLVIQQTAVRRIYFSPSSAAVFQFEKLEEGKGTVAPKSVIRKGGQVAWLAEDGFYLNGEPIGADKVDRWFIDRIDLDRLYSVQGASHPYGPYFIWVARTGSGDTYDTGLIYNWRIGRWAEWSDNVSALAGAAATAGTTLEGLDTPYPDLDVDVPYSLDSRIWAGGRPTFGVFNTAYKLCWYEGDNLAAAAETGDMELVPGRRSMVTEVTPDVGVDGSAAGDTDLTVQVRTRMRPQDIGTWSAAASLQASGRCKVRAAGNWHRFRVSMPAGSNWTHAVGVTPNARPLGAR